jgi:hypothetical protein
MHLKVPKAPAAGEVAKGAMLGSWRMEGPSRIPDSGEYDSLNRGRKSSPEAWSRLMVSAIPRPRANPDTLPADTEWQVSDYVVRPRHVLDLGPEFYRLYFDRNQRLVAAVTFQPPRRVTREELVGHYPSLKFEGRRLGPADAFVAPLGQCVSFAGRLRIDTKQVDQLSYVYTCPTKPGPRTIRRP